MEAKTKLGEQSQPSGSKQKKLGKLTHGYTHPTTTHRKKNKKKHHLSFKRAEQGLLGTQDLNRRRGLLGEVDQRPRVRDEPRSHELSDHDGEVRRDSLHAAAEVVRQLQPVLGQRHHLTQGKEGSSNNNNNKMIVFFRTVTRLRDSLRDALKEGRQQQRKWIVFLEPLRLKEIR